MRSFSQSADRDSWVHTVLGNQNFQAKKGFFAWWYRHTSPPDPPQGASFHLRDRIRRGRIASACMLFLATILVLVALVAYLAPTNRSQMSSIPSIRSSSSAFFSIVGGLSISLA